MKSLISMAVILFAAISLVACESMMFGMPESQFRSLTPAQQQEVIEGYNQRKLVEKQNEPLNNLVGVANTAVWQRNIQAH